MREPGARGRLVGADGRRITPAEGRALVDAVTRGMRVFDDYVGQGTVLSVVPQERETEMLVRFDSGAEGWRLVFSLLVEAQGS